MKVLQRAIERGLVHPPGWLQDGCHYLTLMGSDAYGVSSGSSDIDIYGFCIPPKHVVYPHTVGVILGFGKQGERFEQWQEHGIDMDEKKYDFSVYSIVKFFQLCMENNPNMIDSLFTPDRCILHLTPIGALVRENRRSFLHKGAWFKFKGYAYSQMAKIRSRTNSSNPRRAETIKEFGYDVKFAYHLVRLLNEAEQILTENDLDLERNREQLKDIRAGKWALDHLESYFAQKESKLEGLYTASTLRPTPDEASIKALLVRCLEMHYGSAQGKAEYDISSVLSEFQSVLDRWKFKVGSS